MVREVVRGSTLWLGLGAEGKGKQEHRRGSGETGRRDAEGSLGCYRVSVGK